jgi:FtsX-like permease family protein
MIHTNPLRTTISFGDGPPVAAGLVSCAQLAHTPVLGRCAPGARAASIVPDIADVQSSDARRVWPPVTISPVRIQDAPVVALAVRTDGSTSAIERARTVLQVAYPTQGAPVTIAENNAERRVLSNQYQQLVDVVILTSLPIAGCSLAVSVAAGLNDRKRPFSLLRLSGASLGILRRVVALESAVPLLIGAVVATAAGFLATQLFLTSQLHYSLRPPGVGYYLVVMAGLAASLGVIASTLPLLARITGPETARNE